MDENMTVPRELVGAMMKRLQHLEERIGRIYMVHRKTGCTDCDLCRDLQQVLAGGMAGSGPGGGPPTWVLPFMDHTSTCGYPDTQCTCSLGPEIPEIDALCKCGHPRRFHAQRGDGTPPHGPCYLHRTEVKTCPCDHFEAARGDVVGLA
jgi:hypothetical protein